jgi:hypothetical protein
VSEPCEAFFPKTRVKDLRGNWQCNAVREFSTVAVVKKTVPRNFAAQYIVFAVFETLKKSVLAERQAFLRSIVTQSNTEEVGP